MSKLSNAWRRFRWSDPGCDISILPVNGSNEVALVVSWEDKPVGRTRYGQVLETFAYKKSAEKVRKQLLDMAHRQLAIAFP